ncbi:DUF362 domain-containing protein [Aeromicrobium flavum]|nr:DUF362 domain-containing protein [Aeromicrobium flavum]
MGTDGPRVLAIGSCRVFRPLRKLAADDHLTLVNAAAHESWFTHTSAAAVQYLDVVQGRREIPHELRGAVMESPFTEWADDMSVELPAADVVVVEVSSMKRHVVDGFHLNAHKVYGIANEGGFDYRRVVHGDTGELPDDHRLKQMTVTPTSLAETVADVQRIEQLTGVPVVLVDHLHALTDGGVVLAGREELAAQLRDAAAETGATFHSTRPLIEEHGQDIALLDVNHYRDEFEITAGKSLLTTIESAAQVSSGSASGRPGPQD